MHISSSFGEAGRDRDALVREVALCPEGDRYGRLAARVLDSAQAGATQSRFQGDRGAAGKVARSINDGIKDALGPGWGAPSTWDQACGPAAQAT